MWSEKLHVLEEPDTERLQLLSNLLEIEVTRHTEPSVRNLSSRFNQRVVDVASVGSFSRITPANEGAASEAQWRCAPFRLQIDL